VAGAKAAATISIISSVLVLAIPSGAKYLQVAVYL